MNLILQWLEGQIIKAKWSWSTSVPSILGGLAALFVEMNKMFDGDPKTIPDDAIVGVAIGLIVSGWNSKSASNHGLPPLPKFQQEAMKAPSDDSTKVSL